MQELKKRNTLEIQHLFRAIGFEPFEEWYDPPTRKNFSVSGVHSYVDKIQRQDPFYHLFSEVEQPILMRSFISTWRRGAEIRFKLPYYPDTKRPDKTFEYNF